MPVQPFPDFKCHLLSPFLPFLSEVSPLPISSLVPHLISRAGRQSTGRPVFNQTEQSRLGAYVIQFLVLMNTDLFIFPSSCGISAEARDHTGYLPQILSTFIFWRLGLLLNLELTNSSRLVGQQTPGYLPFFAYLVMG